MFQKFLAIIGLQVPMRFLRAGLSVLSVVAAFLTGIGLIAAAAIRNDNLASKLLPHYPRYSLAMDGFHALQDMKYQALGGKDADGKQQYINVGVLSIDDPPWRVMLDFIESETAIRKSERNEPSPSQPALQPSAPAEAPPQSSAQTQAQLPPIDFDRVKTITSFRIDVMSAGSKPLVPPYNLVVIWPPPTARRVYEFLSFEEFRLDLRRMILDEIQASLLWLSVIAFGCTVLINALRAFTTSVEQRRTIG